MKVHKLAEYFPLLEGEEFNLLVEDIKVNGQLEPIVMFNGEILDGVNRARACEQLGIEPVTKEYTGSDPLAYVVSENIRRRHLDTSQRAMLSVEMLPVFEAQAKERLKTSLPGGGRAGSKDPEEDWHRARDDAANVFGVSGPSVQRAKRIKKKAPKEVAAIIKGKKTVTQVDQEIRQKEAEKFGAADKAKKDKKEVAETPKAVKAYLDAAKEYSKALESAVKFAAAGRFSPEAMRFVVTRHARIREQMTALEKSYSEARG